MRYKIALLIASIALISGCASPAATSQRTIPMITSSPTPTEMPAPLNDLKLAGSLWIYQSLRTVEFIEVVNLATGETLKADLPDGCEVHPATQKFLICKSEDGLLSLRNPITGYRLDLGIPFPDWITVSPQGGYLLYPVSASSGVVLLEKMNIDNRVVEQFSIPAQDVEGHFWFANPILSFDGQYVAVGKVGYGGEAVLEIYDLYSEGREVFDIGFPSAPELGGDFNWSPTTNMLIVGAVEGVTDTPLPSSQVYVVDPGNGNIKEAIHSLEFPFRPFGSNRPVWSPSSDMATITTQDDLCILKIATVELECIALGHLSTSIWSPRENYVLVYDVRTGTAADHAFIVVDAEDLTLFETSVTTFPYYFWWVP